MKIILAAVDDSAEHSAVLEHTAKMAAQFEALVHVVSIATPESGWSAALGCGFAGVSQSMQNRLRAALKQACSELGTLGVECTTHAAVGPVAKEIARLGAEIGADLIVIGHRNLSWLDRLLDDSVGESLLSCAPCNVLVVVNAAQRQS